MCFPDSSVSSLVPRDFSATRVITTPLPYRSTKDDVDDDDKQETKPTIVRRTRPTYSSLNSSDQSTSSRVPHVRPSSKVLCNTAFLARLLLIRQRALKCLDLHRETLIRGPLHARSMHKGERQKTDDHRLTAEDATTTCDKRRATYAMRHMTYDIRSMQIQDQSLSSPLRYLSRHLGSQDRELQWSSTQGPKIRSHREPAKRNERPGRARRSPPPPPPPPAAAQLRHEQSSCRSPSRSWRSP